MKKRLALILALTLIATASFGCGKDESKDTAVQKNENQNKEEEADASEKTIEPSVPEYAITSVGADGYEYFEGSVECLQITDDRHEALAKAIDELFSGRVSNFNSRIEDQNKEAESFNKENEKNAQEEGYDYEPIKYQESQYVTVIRADEEVLSFTVTSSYYFGGAHGSEVYEGFTFDANTGEQLTMADYGDEKKMALVAKDFILTSIEESSDTAKEMLFDDDVTSYKTVIEDYFSGETLPENYLDHTGVTFVFQQYDIAPYAAGISKFTVPYSYFENFNTAYIPKDGFYTMELSEQGLISKIDVNGDGTFENVYIINEYPEDSEADYVLNVGDADITRTLGEGNYASGTFVHAKDGNYIIVNSNGKIVLFEVSNGIRELGSLETDKIIREIKNGEIILADFTYTDEGIKWGENEIHKYSKSGIE
ncbi:DUF3298 and DUF4163 domain-containing protein [Pseudobutyrivibrio sp.]|uniref:DUF3298 and DUF4163 domain-containing protein n=1 Tax=Pseudobutyrivibrio sp. TaxID=2014367 RepID=UPI001B47156D|nr:DUF3298 and DUF4163 domain-containing protein [Pseudobutyrivibrio sp.]MBP3262876.1 DUF3298 domain-containing protein [Pseudobutyrivibrio sp.]